MTSEPAGLSAWLARRSTGRVAAVAAALFVVFTGLVLPAQAARARAYAGPAGTPDTSFLYSAADLYRMAEAYGPAGRTAYLQARFTFDLVWPVVYTVFLVTAISWLIRRAGGERTWLRANLVPLVGMGFDYLENVGAALVIGRYPAPTPVADVVTPMFTLLKWVFVNGSFLIVIGAAVVLLLQRIRRD